MLRGDMERYMAMITCFGKQKYLGTFDTPEEAHQIYLEARKSFEEVLKEKN